MKIEVLGTSCADCITLYENAKRTHDESGKQGEVLKVESLAGAWFIWQAF